MLSPGRWLRFRVTIMFYRVTSASIIARVVAHPPPPPPAPTSRPIKWPPIRMWVGSALPDISITLLKSILIYAWSCRILIIPTMQFSFFSYFFIIFNWKYRCRTNLKLSEISEFFLSLFPGINNMLDIDICRNNVDCTRVLGTQEYSLIKWKCLNFS